jgi:hypothetical protein
VKTLIVGRPILQCQGGDLGTLSEYDRRGEDDDGLSALAHGSCQGTFEIA